MSTDKPPDISYIVEKLPEPLKPKALKEKLYLALVQEQGYTWSNESRIPGYYDCVKQDGIEISGVIFSQRQELRVDVSVLVNGLQDESFGQTYCGGLTYLTPREQIYVTEGNLTEVLRRLDYLTARGRIIIGSNPDKRIV